MTTQGSASSQDGQSYQLRAQHLTCGREVQLFNPIHFELKSGQALLITGANGVGKTTLLRVLAGLLPAMHGHIYWNQQLLKTVLTEYQQHIAYLGPHNGVKPALSVLENIYYFNKPALDAHNVQIMLNNLKLNTLQNTLCAQLSSGQKQRVALARVALSHAMLWILDEPTTALDNQGEQMLATLLSTHLASGGMAIIASHQVLTNEQNMQKIHLEQVLQASGATC